MSGTNIMLLCLLSVSDLREAMYVEYRGWPFGRPGWKKKYTAAAEKFGGTTRPLAPADLEPLRGSGFGGWDGV